MRIFIGAGVVVGGDDEDEYQIKLWLGHYRRWNYLLRLAREAGNFGEIVRWEQAVENEAEWLRHFLSEDYDSKALDRYLESEKRYIRDRSEHCLWCWYGFGPASDELRETISTLRWPKAFTIKYYARPGGQKGWVILQPRLGVPPLPQAE